MTSGNVVGVRITPIHVLYWLFFFNSSYFQHGFDSHMDEHPHFGIKETIVALCVGTMVFLFCTIRQFFVYQ